MTSSKKCTNKVTPSNVNVSLVIHDDKSLEIRSRYSDVEIIKTILDCALTNQPILLFPKFKRNIIEVMATLQAKNLIEFNQEKFTYKYKI